MNATDLMLVPAGVAMVLLSGWLLWLNRGDQPARAFAFAAAARAVALVSLGLARPVCGGVCDSTGLERRRRLIRLRSNL